MEQQEIREQWESAAPGWAKWEGKIAKLVDPATQVMLEMAGVVTGAKVLDLACGAGSQTLMAARKVGSKGHVVACDISANMLQYVSENAEEAQLENISTKRGAAEEIDFPTGSFDAAICRLGLMLFANPSRALNKVRHALKSGGKLAVVVFTVPGANPFMARPMQVLLRHAGKKPPAPGQPGIFALGAPGVIERLLTSNGFEEIEKRTFSLSLKLNSSKEALLILQEAAGVYRAILKDSPDPVRAAAWKEVAEVLRSFETTTGFEAPVEVLVVMGKAR